MSMSSSTALDRAVLIATMLAGLATPALGHPMEGELTVVVRDASGLPVVARVELLGWVPRFRTEVICDAEGRAHLKRLPLGLYRLQVMRPGFQTVSERLEIPSELPLRRQITLQVADLETAVTVDESAPLLDPSQARMALQVGREQMQESFFSTLGRGTTGLIDDLPGWLLEANAVLHPRGSEYDTQYVIDGLAMYDNRSISFVPGFETDEFEAVRVMTAGMPAEFGRRLGGVIQLSTRRAQRPGHHPEVALQGGSFDTYEGAFSDQYQRAGTSFSVGLRGGHTNRYLDPPALENFSNRGNSLGYDGRFERDLTGADRLSVYLRSSRVNFQVPNDLRQQQAGQRQDRRGAETAGQIHYQHVFSPRALGTVRAMVRDATAGLWSNPRSTPLFVEQDRGFREAVITPSVTIESERHAFKVGGDWRLADLREDFLFAESADLPAIALDFRARRRSREVSLYVQDHLRLGNWVIDAGLRFDHYRLLVKDSAVSPRLAAAYYWQAAGLLLRGSYDRVFQTPPLENLLLSSLVDSQSLDAIEGVLALPASRANFWELGIRKAFGDLFRLDVNHFWRDFADFYDDDVFLNTGVSFPISFDSARIEGTEVRLEMPRYRGVTSYISYSNLLGTATSPVTGGLFVEGGEAQELRDVRRTFPISQDQRNTVRAVLRWQPHPRVWLMVRGRYGSGLPVELERDNDTDRAPAAGPATEAPDPGQAAHPGNDPPLAGFPREVLDQIDFERGRVRPNLNFDVSLGARLWRQGSRSLRLQFDVLNATDRLNVINFSGLFSGTALAPGRMFGLRLVAGL